MPRLCPKCSTIIAFTLFVLPEFIHQYRCKSCESRIVATRGISWPLGAFYLIISYAIYRSIDDNLKEALVILPAALIFVIIEYLYAPIKVIDN